MLAGIRISKGLPASFFVLGHSFLPKTVSLYPYRPHGTSCAVLNFLGYE